jgi:hypothetical protein
MRPLAFPDGTIVGGKVRKHRTTGAPFLVVMRPAQRGNMREITVVINKQIAQDYYMHAC